MCLLLNTTDGYCSFGYVVFKFWHFQGQRLIRGTGACRWLRQEADDLSQFS